MPASAGIFFSADASAPLRCARHIAVQQFPP